MKVFKNERTLNNNELPLRKGTKVPDGAVSLAWHKSPDLNPKNHVVVIDTTSGSSRETSDLSLAYANALGVLEDKYGNQSWPEEFPIIGDQFLVPDSVESPSDFLPYAHASRFFHLDYTGLASTGSLSEAPKGLNIKVIDNKGREYSDDNGNALYKIFLINVPIDRPANSVDAIYRIWIFLNQDPVNDELFLVYHKVEFDQDTQDIRDEYIGYKEPLSVREYYKYTPEECEVIDQGSNDKKIYSTKPIDFKDQVTGRSQPNYKGWKIYVPKKSIPDPRKFELFRWRVACEYSRTVDPNETRSGSQQIAIRAGVVNYNASAGGSQSRSNYVFTQLNESSYNTGGIRFINPINANVSLTQEDAAYWQVPILDLSVDELSQFDILVWSATSSSVDIDSILPKIEYFVETLGGTFIFETCSRTNFNIPGVTFSTPLSNLKDAPQNRVTVGDLRYSTPTPFVTNSTTGGMYSSWPPRLEDLMTNNSHSSHVLRKLNFLGGWDLDTASELTASAYKNLTNSNSLGFQYISSHGSEWEPVLESKRTISSTYNPVFIRKKHTSGGSYYISTACLFEDHILDANSRLLSSTYHVGSLNQMSPQAREDFSFAADSIQMEGEMKLRVNIVMLATAFRPSANPSISSDSGFNKDYNRHSVTLYSDWQSSWVINAHGGILSDEEKAKNNFVLLPKNPEDVNPVWMRILNDKTVSEIMAEKIKQIDPDGSQLALQNLSGINRRYMILITNQNVETYTYNLINDNTLPAAWTYVFSPPFKIPAEIGAHEIREEMVGGTGVGEGKRIYPERPFNLKATASYVTTSVDPHQIEVDVTFTGTARAIYKIPEQRIEEKLPVPAYTVGWWVDKKLRWITDQDPATYEATRTLGSQYDHMGDMRIGKGVQIWGHENYHANPRPNNWADWSFHGVHRRGMRSDIVVWIQRFLNQFVFFNFISGPAPKDDGYFGPVTEAAIHRLQVARGAIYQDGVVDAETWAIIGYAMASLYDYGVWRDSQRTSHLLTLASYASRNMRRHNISSLASTNGVPNNYMTQSNALNGPPSISEGYMLKFDPNFSDAEYNGKFRMYELWVKPAAWAYDANPTSYLTWLDVGTDLDLKNYNFSHGSHGNIYHPMSVGQYKVISFAKREANSIIFRQRKDGRLGPQYDTAISMGIEDVFVMADTYVYNSSPPPQPQTKVTIIEGRTIVAIVNIQATQRMTLRYGIPKDADSSIKNGTSVDDVVITKIDNLSGLTALGRPSEIAEIRWETYDIQPSSKAGSISVVPKYLMEQGTQVSKTFTLTYNNTTTSVDEPNYISGSTIGSGGPEFYVKPLGDEVEPFPRQYGWVSKNQGVLLITNAAGKPFGFPGAAPRNKEATFTRLTLDAWGHDQTTYYGFYDVNTKQWLENRSGDPDISYYDYVRRGVNNVYIAVQTTYEIDTTSNLPAPDEPVLRPFKTAMPIYGVKIRKESSVKLINPSEELGSKDIWPIMVGTGSFTKKIRVDQEYADKSLNYLKDYGNKVVNAYYSVRESFDGPWSKLLGKPYRDIYGEQPRLLSDKDIKVNFYPIASIQEPTYYPNLSDPITPFFTVYRRDAIGDEWVRVGLKDIESYDLPKGIITLETPLLEQDSRLIKVNYTARDYSYRYIYQDGKRINLNPYVLKLRETDSDHLDILDKPIYVYLKPNFVVDDTTKNVINESKNNRIVFATTDKTIFDQNQANYDPLAYRLGSVFSMTTADINSLNILDTRVRGGGGKHNLVNSKFSSYWDMPSDKAYAYQKGGFVLIGLPGEILDDFESEQDIRDVIERNLTVGTAYEIIYDKTIGLGFNFLGESALGD